MRNFNAGIGEKKVKTIKKNSKDLIQIVWTTNNDLQNITQKTKDWDTRTPQKNQ